MIWNKIKDVFAVISAVVLVAVTLIIRLLPLLLFIYLIIQSYLDNIAYPTAILIAISVSSIFLLFNSIITSYRLMVLNSMNIGKPKSEKDIKRYSKLIISGAVLDILKILTILISAVLFYLENYTYAYYLVLLQFIMLILYALFTMLDKNLRIASYMSIAFNVIVIILGLIFIKHAEIILVIYYIFSYIMFLKTFYVKR